MPRAEASRKRCAIYTRKSSEEGLEQEFNSLAAQREACEAYIRSQRHEGWLLARSRYDDGGFSGGNLERPAAQRLLTDIRAGRVAIVVVYKVDRLTRSLADFARLVELFDAQGVSFVSVTQQFNTTSSMGRLTLNVLLSFAQFEREVTGERIRDKIAASKKKGMWMGGNVPLGYDANERTLVINPAEAETVRRVFAHRDERRAALRPPPGRGARDAVHPRHRPLAARPVPLDTSADGRARAAPGGDRDAGAERRPSRLSGVRTGTQPYAAIRTRERAFPLHNTLFTSGRT